MSSVGRSVNVLGVTLVVGFRHVTRGRTNNRIPSRVAVVAVVTGDSAGKSTITGSCMVTRGRKRQYGVEAEERLTGAGRGVGAEWRKWGGGGG